MLEIQGYKHLTYIAIICVQIWRACVRLQVCPRVAFYRSYIIKLVSHTSSDIFHVSRPKSNSGNLSLGL